jgi:hypothetical protein
MTSCFTGIPLIGFLDPGVLALKLLAVLGGVTLGVVGTGWLVKIMAKMLAFQKVSPLLLRLSRLLGGLTVGLVVWSVFNAGGFLGLGGSGWGPAGQGGGAGPSGAGQNARQQTKGEEATTPEQRLRIHMLGGALAQENQRFYVLEEDAPRTWSELETVLTQRLENSNFKIIEIVIGKGSVDKENPAVKKLEEWAEKNGVAVKLEAPS